MLAPSVLLTAILICVAVLDAAAGLVGVLGFLLGVLPGLFVSLACLVGRDGPVPERSWRNELLGALVVAASVALVLNA